MTNIIKWAEGHALFIIFNIKLAIVLILYIIVINGINSVLNTQATFGHTDDYHKQNTIIMLLKQYNFAFTHSNDCLL